MTNRWPNSVVDDVPFQHQQTWMLGANAFVPSCGAGGGASPELHSALGGVCVCVCKYIFLFRLHICDFQYISTVATPTKETAVTGVTQSGWIAAWLRFQQNIGQSRPGSVT